MATIYHNGIQVNFDDLQVELIDRVEHSCFYKATGYDAMGRQYEATSEFCCGDFEAVSDIERVSNMHHNRKPYQARTLLKSINYWKDVISGNKTAKRPLAYYKNKLSYYTEIDIKYLSDTSSKII